MKLHTFLEKKGENAHRQAVAMGLQYKGFGYWVDPQSGEVTHKTENDQLVPVTPDVESEKFAGDKEGAGMAPPGAGGQMAMPGVAAAGAMGMAPMGQGMNVGPATDQAKAPAEKKGWDSGPDGDTCVGGQPREELPTDTFVGKTNYLKWTAGMDGSNAIELGGLREEIKQIEEGGETDLGSDYVPLNTQQKNAKKQRENLKARAKAGMKKANALFNKGEEPDFPLGQNTVRALNKRRKKEFQNPSQYMRGLEFMKKHDLAGGTGSKQYRDENGRIQNYSGYDYDDYDDERPEMPSWVGGGTSKVQGKDEELVRGMNRDIAGFMKDPKYDLDQYDDRKPLASGAFGSFTLGDDGVGVKVGNIGPGELAALYAMRDNPAFPTLINARFDGPFKHQSAAANNPGDLSDPAFRRGTGEDNYFDPDEASQFEDKFPGAWGKYAMTTAKGEDLFSAVSQMTPEIKAKFLRNFWRARGDLHKAGFSHNDMHGGNIMVDPETGETSILDLGLAKDNPLSALMEAIGGFNYEEGNDYQLSPQVSGSSIPEKIRAAMTDRLGAFEERMMDDYDGDMDDEMAFDGAMKNLAGLLTGDIRMTNDDFDRIKGQFPRLGDNDYVKERIAELYEGMFDGDEELEVPDSKPDTRGTQTRRGDDILDAVIKNARRNARNQSPSAKTSTAAKKLKQVLDIDD